MQFLQVFPIVAGFDTSSNSTALSRQSGSVLPATDCSQIHQQLAHHFEDLHDPRGKQGVLHPFISIVMIALLATIGGAQGWEDIETNGVSHQCWLSSFLPLPFGIPSAIPIVDCLRGYRPQHLSAVFIAG
ncbi:hypothetical protein DP117_17785 [Brasilonema sp. UFV-L1]|uniref:transposase family protein n=1 Tax=Brasilonema sp. UFV-L1 TaxID=2234130 RepID=UPI00145C7677|nr:hypothetical protein [Brasilonema sp. UFV-L1]